MSAGVIADDSVRSAPTSLQYDSKQAPLDPTFYDVDVEFLSLLTGIKDPEELKKHVLQVQADAYAVYPYPCIRNFTITKTKVDRYPAYRDLLQLGKERKGAIFLDVGCCVGNDLRKAVLDGFPVNQVLGTDLNPSSCYHGIAEFWEVGHKLFKSTPETFPVKLIPGNIFEQSFLDPEAKVQDPTPDISTLTNLTPLVGHVSVIHSSAFFHLFDESHQLQIATLFAALLSPEPGSLILGKHVGLPEKSLRMSAIQPGQIDRSIRMFCHSPESWTEMWEGVFGKGKVEVWAELKQEVRKDRVLLTNDSRAWQLIWSVKRL
ncbi:hypothetical protein BDY19DRAFT_96758 [Irpex rosettiformis]|uniref:Uncharacterized protein n=1 Tax=Irpex rosettiformis TaxID=378272 RepID=A0ACB8U6R2_9APHY|nr:hypothetical protein BDY19DRAFT_96758 [Irpex rosettiformis]